MWDVVEVLGISALLAALLTAHALIFLGLMARGRRLRALSGLLFPPLAPYWAWQNALHKRAIAWTSLAVTYGAALLWIIYHS